eukprot:gene11374-biopygen7263
MLRRLDLTRVGGADIADEVLFATGTVDDQVGGKDATDTDGTAAHLCHWRHGGKMAAQLGGTVAEWQQMAAKRQHGGMEAKLAAKFAASWRQCPLHEACSQSPPRTVLWLPESNN